MTLETMHHVCLACILKARREFEVTGVKRQVQLSCLTAEDDEPCPEDTCCECGRTSRGNDKNDDRNPIE